MVLHSGHRSSQRGTELCAKNVAIPLLLDLIRGTTDYQLSRLDLAGVLELNTCSRRLE